MYIEIQQEAVEKAVEKEHKKQQEAVEKAVGEEHKKQQEAVERTAVNSLLKTARALMANLSLSADQALQAMSGDRQ